MANRKIYKPWVKLHIRILSNEDIAELSDSSKWKFIECLLLAGEERNRAIESGDEQEDGYLPRIKRMAHLLQTTQSGLRDDLSRLALAGLVELRRHPDGEDRWFVTNFTKWQEPTGATERQRFARAARKNQEQEEEERIRIIDVGNLSQISHENVTESKTPLEALQDYFTQQTATYPNDRNGTYELDWRQPLEAILSQTNGNTAAAIAAVDAALQVARGHNERGKTYTVASPRSISGMAVNHINASNGQATVSEDDNLWQRAMRAIAQRDYSDGRLKAAIAAVGFDRITRAGDKEVTQLKRSLGDEYRRIPATA